MNLLFYVSTFCKVYKGLKARLQEGFVLACATKQMLMPGAPLSVDISSLAQQRQPAACQLLESSALTTGLSSDLLQITRLRNNVGAKPQPPHYHLAAVIRQSLAVGAQGPGGDWEQPRSYESNAWDKDKQLPGHTAARHLVM